GNTALMQAVKYNAIAVARLLIDSSADINARDYEGKTALKIAEEKEATDVIALLKVAGAKE
ncbi:MAG: ankyrin repeat domain-containing protein, partial [Treponema sp.]|nr:ankyrin repeat domain-containing protein [Treponema sp.]